MDYNVAGGSLLGALAGTLTGGGIAAYATYRLGIYMLKNQRMQANNEIRKNDIYEPLYNEIGKIQKNFLARSNNELSYEVSCEPTPDLILWRRIRSDNRLFLVNNGQVEEKCNNLYQLLYEYNSLYEKTVAHFCERTRLFFKEKYEAAPVQEPSSALFALTIYDKRFDAARAFDGVFAKMYFELKDWGEIEADTHKRGDAPVLEEYLAFIGYAEFQKTHDSLSRKITQSLAECREVLLKEVRKIIKEGER